MASKTYSLLAGAFCLLASAGFGQRVGSSYDVKDSSVVPSKRMPQHTEFLNGTYNFPAKPRNQWEVGLKAGFFSLSSDVPAQFPTPGFGIHVRKAMGYIFSVRLEYMYGIGKGLSWLTSENYAKNPAWAKYNSPIDRHDGGPLVSSLNGQPFSATNKEQLVYYNYKAKVQDLVMEGIFTLNNIRFHKAKTGFNAYAIVGFGGMVYDTKVNALNSNNQKYNFASITPSNVYKD